jgi:hypothetical protein
VNEPVRLRHLRGRLDEELSLALEERAVEPSQFELERLTEQLSGALGATLPAPLAAPPLVAAGVKGGFSLAAWVFGGVVLGVGLSATGAALVDTSDGPTPKAAARGTATGRTTAGLGALSPPVATAPVATEGARIEAEDDARVAPMTRPRDTSNHDPLARSAATPSEGELSLLRRAQEASRNNPTEALALTALHAQEYPSGLLAQEREVIAIDSLVRLRRLAPARARAAAFSERYPGSAHRRRIELLLTDAGP